MSSSWSRDTLVEFTLAQTGSSTLTKLLVTPWRLVGSWTRLPRSRRARRSIDCGAAHEAANAHAQRRLHSQRLYITVGEIYGTLHIYIYFLPGQRHDPFGLTRGTIYWWQDHRVCRVTWGKGGSDLG